MAVLIITFGVCGLALVAVSVPLIRGWIPPNHWYGFRVRKTLEHPEIWYPVNKYGGERLLLSGVLLVLTAVGYSFIPGIGPDVYAYAVLVTWVIGSSIAIVGAFRYMNSL
ncbi:MAG: SdpI family protein [Anaerolineales bacterium]